MFMLQLVHHKAALVLLMLHAALVLCLFGYCFTSLATVKIFQENETRGSKKILNTPTNLCTQIC